MANIAARTVPPLLIAIGVPGLIIAYSMQITFGLRGGRPLITREFLRARGPTRILVAVVASVGLVKVIARALLGVRVRRIARRVCYSSRPSTSNFITNTVVVIFSFCCY